ncbi:MAG: hypothetical protein VX294_02125 [Candidatus Latescibacterota bacterium]|nr:hypothetical protein [Candidatus Latescibacterota bacterium]
MNNSLRLSSTLLLLIFTATEILSKESSSLRWPLDIKPALSSSFGESRTSSFHMGIDLKTWGRTGYVVRAVSSGFIERVRTSPWGYGRAVYLRLNDGRLVVYGHLEEFGEFLKDRVANAQSKTGSYSIDLWFSEEEFKVSTGDVVGFTGESGAGPPHLHFEVRDKNNEPINPLKTDYSVTDLINPTLNSIAFIPIGWDSSVNGFRNPFSSQLYWDDIEQVFKTSSSIQIEGQVGVALWGWDRADAATNKLAPYELELRVGDEVFFSARYDRATYSLGHQIFLDRIKIETQQGIGDFYALFRSKGNRLPFYLNNSDGFVRTYSIDREFGLSKGEHWLEVTASDVVGQSASARVKVIVNSSPTIRYADWGRNDSVLTVNVVDVDDSLLKGTLYGLRDDDWAVVSNGVVAGNRLFDWPLRGQNLFWKWEIKDGYGAGDSIIFSRSISNGGKDLLDVAEICRARWIEWDIKTEQPLSTFPDARIATRRGEVKQIGRSRYLASFPLVYGELDQVSLSFISGSARYSGKASQRALVPGKARQLMFEDGDVLIDVGVNSVYDTLFPQVRRSVLNDLNGFKVISPSFLISPVNVPFDERIRIGIRVDPAQALDQRIGLYGSSDGNYWTLLGNDRMDGYISASVRKFSFIALLADHVKPALEIVAPIENTSVGTTHPHVKVMVRDDQSGIVLEEDIAIVFDEKSLIVEYDPEGHKATASLDQPLEPGSHVIEASAQDAAGNKKIVRSVFTVGF